MTNRDQRRLFYVVQLLELPFEDIDEYVCVPYSWIIFQKSQNRKIVVTYPNNEDPLETRERVKRKERPNDLWRFYRACLKYDSDDFEDADLWIAKNEYGPIDEVSEKKDTTKPRPQLNRKLRSANQSHWSDSNSDKPQVTVKPYNNSRKPLPRISIRRPLSQESNQNLNKKSLKLNEKAKPGILTDNITPASDSLIQEQSIIIISDQVIQKDQKKTNYASNGEMNTEQSTQPEVIKEKQSVDLSIQSTSAKLSVDNQLSPQPPTEQQPSLQPPTGREPTPQPPIDRQPSPKFIAEKHSSSKFSGKQEPSSVGQNYQQPVRMSVINLDISKGELDSCQNVLPKHITDERPSTKTPPSTFKPAPQSNPINERSTPLVRHEHSLPEPHSRDVIAGQSKEPNDCQKNQLHWILTTPTIVPRPPSTTNQLLQQHGYSQSPISSVNSTLNSKFHPQGFSGRNSTEVADNPSFLRSQDIINSMPSTSHHEHTSEKLTQMLNLKAKQKSSAMQKLKNPIDKKTRLEGITKNIASQQYPPNSIRRLGLPGGRTVAQSAQFAQHHLQQAQIDGSRINDDRRGMRENFISQRDPRAQGMMNTTAAQNLSTLAHQYNSFLGTSHEQHLLTREEYLQQFTRFQDMLRRPTMIPTLDQKVYHKNAMMNGGFVLQSQLNPINQSIQFLPQNVNQYAPINSAYSQEVQSHELIKRHTDGTYVIYKPIAPNELNIQLPAHHLSSQSHRDAGHLQKIQDQQNYQDPGTTNTQNSLPLKSKRSSPIPTPQKVTKRSRSLSTSKTPSQTLFDAQKSCLIQELGVQKRVNQSSTKSNNTDLVTIPETQTVELASSTENTEVQTMPSSNQIQETQCTLVQNKHACQCSGIKKIMIDQATEMDSMINVSQCVEPIASSSLCESASGAVKSVCQTDEWLEQEDDLLYQESSSDDDHATDNEIESEIEVVPEAHQVAMTSEQNLTQKNEHEQSRRIIEQDMLGVIGTLFTQMGANLSFTCDMLNSLRNSTLVCAQTYKTLLEKVDELNLIESLRNSASPPNNVISQVTQKRPTEDDDNTTSVGNATTSICEQRGTFSLPAEYDPNDTKWTLKYRENKPGLVELIPETGVYVKRKELKRCIRKSSDCRTLARLLLTEVFSQIALSVCSWTGGKAKAFNSVNIDVRPGLDENARMVLLTFVEQHGKNRGWSLANTSAVMSTIRTKINDIRAKHEQAGKV